MERYILRRLAVVVPVLFGITVIAFALLALAPGDAVDALVIDAQQGAALNAADIASLKHQYGLDRPLPVRYTIWLGQILHGNLGRRVVDGSSVGRLIAERLPRTIELMGAALLLGIGIGVALGIVTALNRNSPLDYLVTLCAFSGVSVPSFVAATGALFIFSVRLHLLPVSGTVTPGQSPGLGQELDHLVLPAGVLATEYVARFVRYTRAGILEELHCDYIKTARAKGLTERAVVLVHILPNALLPVITVIGLSLPSLVGGAVIVETIFNWPGLGSLFFTSISQRDYATVMAMVLISGVIVLLSNLVTDLAYAVADPRIRYG